MFKLIVICIYITGLAGVAGAGLSLDLPIFAIALLDIVWAVCATFVLSLEG